MEPGSESRHAVGTILGRRKGEEEITAIQEVRQATEAAIAEVISYLARSEQPTSEEAHRLIDHVLEKHGCESPMGHIVSSGLQTHEPHDVGSGEIKKGVPVVIDIYPRSKRTGYYADLTRTVCIGEPSPEVERMYNAVLKAQDIAFSMIAPGAIGGDMQKAVEDYFISEGYETSGTGTEFRYAEGFVHGLGHGVGLEVHEAPRLGRGSTDILAEGDVVTVEPGLYYSNIGGVRIEDMVYVTSTGFEHLSTFPRTLRI